MGILDFFGIVDMFWVFIIMFSLWAVDKKNVRWLVPITCVIGMAIHEYFTITYMVPCAIMIYHQFAKKPTVSNFVYISLSALLLAAASYYFLFLGSETMKITANELFDYVKNRTIIQEDTYGEIYVKSIFFWKENPLSIHNVNPEDITYMTYIKVLIREYTASSSKYVRSIILFILSSGLISFPFTWIFTKAFIFEKSALKKITYLVSLSIIFLGIIYQFVSTDDTRFMFHFIIMIIFLLLFMVKEKEKIFIAKYTELSDKLNQPIVVITILLVTKFLFSGVVN